MVQSCANVKQKKKLFPFIVGLILIIFGWFGNNATHIDWLMKIISPTSANAIYALDKFASDKEIGATSEAGGFNELLEYWPKMDTPQSVKLIKRSVAYIALGGPQAKNDFELKACNRNGDVIGWWTETQARELFLQKQDNILFWFGAVVFWLGFIITAFSGVSEFREKKTES